MADQKLDVFYVKSPHWRAVAATGAATNAIGGPSGFEYQMRFTYEWMDVEKEVVTAHVDKTATNEIVTVTTPPQLIQTPFYKIEEVAVRMTPEGIVALVVGLLNQFTQLRPPNQLTDIQKKRIQDAHEAFQNS